VHLAELLSTDRRGRGIGTTKVPANASHRPNADEQGVERLDQSAEQRSRFIGWRLPVERSRPTVDAVPCRRDLNHITGFEPVLSFPHQNVMHASLQALTLKIEDQDNDPP